MINELLGFKDGKIVKQNSFFSDIGHISFEWTRGVHSSDRYLGFYPS